MSTLVNTDDKSQRAYLPTTALAQSVDFDEDTMHVLLTDGRRISVPIAWFPLLLKASPEQRTKYEIGGGGTSLHWPELDEDLSMAGLMAGADLQNS
ncbi:MAG TPA: DUF2442 domain-containing protein [Pyrinomonadaceae bacterium]|jgi:hypothetical protein|nr:DUF2442 domain-containing protein [Pyrinomonadaceae bacterium]